MKAFLTFFSLLLIPVIVTSQNVVIKGIVYGHNTHQPTPYTNIYFDSTYQTISNEFGEFLIEISLDTIEDTLKIEYIGCFDLKFINLPKNTEVIDLDSIPIFEYFPGYDMTHFDCLDDDEDCKERERKHIKKENGRVQKYFEKQNTFIENYNYRFRNNNYKIDLNNGIINLQD